MAVFSIRLDDDLHQILRTEAYNRRTSISRLIREAVLAWLAREDDPA